MVLDRWNFILIILTWFVFVKVSYVKIVRTLSRVIVYSTTTKRKDWKKKRNKNKKQRAALIYCHRFLRRGNWLRWSCLPGSITNNNNNLSIHIVIFCSSFQPSLLFGKTSRKSFSWKQHLVSSPKLREESL